MMERLAREIEAVLFASDEPISISKLALGLNTEEKNIELAVSCLEKDYENRAFQIQRVSGKLLLMTRPEYSHVISQVLSKRVTPSLSKGATETLAIIAYHQPVTRQDIETARGVNPEASIETLLEKGLIREAGRKKTLGRPKLYATTDEFLRKACLNSLQDLPPLSTEGNGDENASLRPIVG
jgi:segregation and condensation protein B